MSRFFVGQRVKCVRKHTACSCAKKKKGAFRNPIGIECVVSGTLSHPSAGFNAHCDFDTSVCVGGMNYMVPSHCLEPLIDPGREVIAWADCVWKPDHLRSRVEVGP